MKMFSITQRIGNSLVQIIPSIRPEGFSKVDAFMVDVSCIPAYKHGKERLMQEVCSILSFLDGVNTTIKTLGVISSSSTEGENFDVNSICFQVITPLCPQWFR